MAIKAYKLQASANDLEAISLIMPVGSTVDLSIAEAHQLTYQVTYGQVSPRLKVLPEIHRALKAQFGTRFIDLKPEPRGARVVIRK